MPRATLASREACDLWSLGVVAALKMFLEKSDLLGELFLEYEKQPSTFASKKRDVLFLISLMILDFHGLLFTRVYSSSCCETSWTRRSLAAGCQHAEVAYVALSGKPPFWGSPKQQVARMRAEKYPLSGEPGHPAKGGSFSRCSNKCWPTFWTLKIIKIQSIKKST